MSRAEIPFENRDPTRFHRAASHVEGLARDVDAAHQRSAFFRFWMRVGPRAVPNMNSAVRIGLGRSSARRANKPSSIAAIISSSVGIAPVRCRCVAHADQGLVVVLPCTRVCPSGATPKTRRALAIVQVGHEHAVFDDHPCSFVSTPSSSTASVPPGARIGIRNDPKSHRVTCSDATRACRSLPAAARNPT